MKVEAELRARLDRSRAALSEFVREAIAEKLRRERAAEVSAYEIGQHCSGTRERPGSLRTNRRAALDEVLQTRLIVDAGPLIALFDRDDRYPVARSSFCVTTGSSSQHLPALTEAAFVLRFSVEAQRDLLWWHEERSTSIRVLQRTCHGSLLCSISTAIYQPRSPTSPL